MAIGLARCFGGGRRKADDWRTGLVLMALIANLFAAIILLRHVGGMDRFLDKVEFVEKCQQFTKSGVP
jgi:hypothetical protein